MSDIGFTLDLPRKTFVGAGALASVREAAEQFSARHIMIFTDRPVADAGLLGRLRKALEGPTTRVTVFDATEPEPTTDSIAAAAKALVEAGEVDLLVSLGGGSVMDTAKCANVVAQNGGVILDFEDDSTRETRPIERLLPHVAVPTTAGTGSEATMWAVYIHPEKRFKTAAGDPRLIADVAILDPELTATMPPRVTAATGLDALTHAIEAYVSAAANPLTDALAERAIAMIAGALLRSVRDGQDLEARSAMLLASFMAGVAFNNSSLGIAHTLAESLGGFYRMPHGVANALMLPAVMEFNVPVREERFASIAALLGTDLAGMSRAEASRAAAHQVRELIAAVGLPRSLREMDVKRTDIPTMAAAVSGFANDSGNPREVTEEQLVALYEQVY